MAETSPSQRDLPEREVEAAREELGRALEIAFARWGEWHRVERAPPPQQEEARLRIARAEDDVVAAQRRFEEAQRRRAAIE